MVRRLTAELLPQCPAFWSISQFYILQGSVLSNFFNNGKLERTGDGSITEGIGQGRVTENLKGAPIDWAMTVDDKESVNMVRR